MFLIIDRALDEPVYRQIARRVGELVSAGELCPGTDLPPVRSLASDLGVNLNTVARAYRQLEAEGFVRIRDRTGARILAPPSSPTATEGRQLTDELRLHLARMRQAGFSGARVRELVDGILETLGGGNG